MIEARDVQEFMEKQAAKNIMINKYFGSGTRNEIMKKILDAPYIPVSIKKKLFETGTRNNPYAMGYMDNRIINIGDEFSKLSPSQKLIAGKLHDMRSIYNTLNSKKFIEWGQDYLPASGKYVGNNVVVDAQDIAKAKLGGPTAFYEAYDDVAPIYKKRLKNLLENIKNEDRDGSNILSDYIKAKNKSAPFFSARDAYDPKTLDLNNLALDRMTNVRMLEAPYIPRHLEDGGAFIYHRRPLSHLALPFQE